MSHKNHPEVKRAREITNTLRKIKNRIVCKMAIWVFQPAKGRYTPVLISQTSAKRFTTIANSSNFSHKNQEAV